jgi:DNA polymerase theta
VKEQNITTVVKAGIDTMGESILMLQPIERKAGIALVQATVEKVRSCLHDDQRGLQRLILDGICGKYTKTEGQLEQFLARTLLALQSSTSAVNKEIPHILQFLERNGMISLSTTAEEREWESTAFGRATSRSNLSPEEAIVLRDELQRARDSLVLSGIIVMCRRLCL